MKLTETDKKARRQARARDRGALWEQLSPVERLAALDARLGSGRGARRQRAAIASQNAIKRV